MTANNEQKNEKQDLVTANKEQKNGSKNLFMAKHGYHLNYMGSLQA